MDAGSRLWKVLPVRWRPHAFNLFPAFRGTGGRVRLVSADFREIAVELPLNWRTRNYVGTIFGGSLYAAVDPFYMIMLIQILGPDYVVWDKAASIRFRKPGRSTLYARFLLPGVGNRRDPPAPRDAALDRPGLSDRVEGRAGRRPRDVEKTIYIRRRRPAAP